MTLSRRCQNHDRECIHKRASASGERPTTRFPRSSLAGKPSFVRVARAAKLSLMTRFPRSSLAGVRSFCVLLSLRSHLSNQHMPIDKDAPTIPTGPPEGSSSTEPSSYDAELVNACEQIVETFRQGRSRKAEAFAQLYRALKIDEMVEIEALHEREQAFETYFDMLDQIDRDRRQVPATNEQPNPQGEAGAPPNLDEPSSSEHTRGDAALDLGSRPDLLSRISDPSPSKRGRDVFEDGSGEEDWVDEDRRKSKRPIDETLFPFVSTEAVQSLSGDLQRTLVLKENYTRDLSLAKQRVVCSPGCPSIPDSVWVDVLANRYVDLDKIFSAIYTVDGDHKSSIKLGELELVGFPTKPKRHVERHGHWTVAWALYQRAVLYVYPHREGELRVYSDQINSFFAAVSEHEASRVINLDRAIRGEVGRSNTLLLSDFSHFNHLYTMHVVGTGAASQSASASSSSLRRSGAPRRITSSTEACIRFNEGRCTSRSCRYRHVCSSCAARDHVAQACPQKVEGGPNPDRRK